MVSGFRILSLTSITADSYSLRSDDSVAVAFGLETMAMAR